MRCATSSTASVPQHVSVGERSARMLATRSRHPSSVRSGKSRRTRWRPTPRGGPPAAPACRRAHARRPGAPSAENSSWRRSACCRDRLSTHQPYDIPTPRLPHSRPPIPLARRPRKTRPCARSWLTSAICPNTGAQPPATASCHQLSPTTQKTTQPPTYAAPTSVIRTAQEPRRHLGKPAAAGRDSPAASPPGGASAAETPRPPVVIPRVFGPAPPADSRTTPGAPGGFPAPGGRADHTHPPRARRPVGPGRGRLGFRARRPPGPPGHRT